MLSTALVVLMKRINKLKKLLNSITFNDTKEWLERQKSRQTKPYKGFNSYVAPNALHEIQCDIMDMTASASLNNGFRYAFVAIAVLVNIYGRYR